VPIESTPTLAPELPRQVTPRPVVRLERSPIARAESVEPVLRSARGEVASLRLRARAAQRAAEQSELALAEHDDSGIAAEREARMAQVAAEIEEANRRRDVELAAAREEADALLAAARAEADAEVAAARSELHAVVAALSTGVVAEPVAAEPDVEDAGAPGAPDEQPDDEPVLPPAAAYPPPGAMPFTGPPSSPVPTVPPPGAGLPAPVVASPFTPVYSSVLIQAADGTLQQALVLATPQAALAAPGVAPFAPHATVAPSAALVPVAAAPSVVEPVSEPAPVPAPPLGRRLLHLDVILPLIAVLIVLVVLLAWLG
jgi:hypothetical protein